MESMSMTASLPPVQQVVNEVFRLVFVSEVRDAFSARVVPVGTTSVSDFVCHHSSPQASLISLRNIAHKM